MLIESLPICVGLIHAQIYYAELMEQDEAVSEFKIIPSHRIGLIGR